MGSRKYKERVNNLPTQKWMREHFSYNKNGFLIRKKYMGGPTYKGQKIEGCFSPTSGYKSISLCNRRYLIHRIIFLHQKGFLPEFLDHKNHNRLDNRIENLRPLTKQLNCFHRKVTCGNLSGVRGLSYRKNKNLWQGIVQFKGIRLQKMSKDRELIESWLLKTRYEILKKNKDAIV